LAESETVPTRAAPQDGVWRDLAQDRPQGLLPGNDRKRVAAALPDQEGWAGTVLVTGDPTHWVQVSAGEIVSFQSFLTGRIAHALGAAEALDEAALNDTMAQPERLAAHLRSAELGGGGAVLGHLIGAEMAATRAFWLGADLRLAGTGALADAYEAALRAQAALVTRV